MSTAGKHINQNIAVNKKIIIGGVKQWILIRGKSFQNPVLFFLHGGPGSAEWPLVRYYNIELEKYFTLVYWDQRGAGKSYSPFIAGMNIPQLFSDAIEMIEYIKTMLSKEKVFVMGHSWGSILGLMVAQKHPELLHAFVGAGVFVAGAENERISYNYVLNRAMETHNKKATKQLTAINDPEPYGAIDPEGRWFKKLLLQRNWLLRLGGSIYGGSKTTSWYKPFFLAPEYSLWNLICWFPAYNLSLKKIWPEIMGINLFKEIPQVEIPVYFLVGKHDYNTPFELTEQYFNHLKAPEKELIWFENSAHSPMYEEPHKYHDVLIKIRK
jgi:pimeloyl-ACP methyl ester carboxylesterase